MDEDTDLKSAGCKSFGGSIPLPSAFLDMKVIICEFCGKESKYRKGKLFCSGLCHSKHIHRISYQDFLCNNDKYCTNNYTPKNFKDFFLEEQNGKCSRCNIDTSWNGENLVFVLDHIDGNASNNKRENLRLICPNCDSQLETFKSKNKNSKRRNYWKEKIIREQR